MLDCVVKVYMKELAKHEPIALPVCQTKHHSIHHSISNIRPNTFFSSPDELSGGIAWGVDHMRRTACFVLAGPPPDVLVLPCGTHSCSRLDIRRYTSKYGSRPTRRRAACATPFGTSSTCSGVLCKGRQGPSYSPRASLSSLHFMDILYSFLVNCFPVSPRLYVIFTFFVHFIANNRPPQVTILFFLPQVPSFGARRQEPNNILVFLQKSS